MATTYRYGAFSWFPPPPLATKFAAANAMQVPFLFNARINILAFMFSAAIGVIFGFFPARRAARLDPIDALRHE